MTKENEIRDILRQHTHDDVIGIIMSYLRDECFMCCEEMLDNDLFPIKEEGIKLCFDCIINNNYRTCLSCNNVGVFRDTYYRYECDRCREKNYFLWLDNWDNALEGLDEVLDILLLD